MAATPSAQLFQYQPETIEYKKYSGNSKDYCPCKNKKVIPDMSTDSIIKCHNQKHRPVMIHRAPFGSMERFVAVLLEHTAGNLPLWLAPEQAVILPISEKFNDYADKVRLELAKSDIRATVDNRNEKIGKKIRDNELKHIPYMLVVGEKEVNNGEISVRKQGEGDKGSVKISTFAENFLHEMEELTKY